VNSKLGGEPTAWDGIWWAVSTMTTVGYGDQFPTTAEGRVLAIVVMLVGIGTLTMLIGAASERFVRPDIAEEAEEVQHELDASGFPPSSRSDPWCQPTATSRR
jgi:voltage-gated potassium channel